MSVRGSDLSPDYPSGQAFQSMRNHFSHGFGITPVEHEPPEPASHLFGILDRFQYPGQCAPPHGIQASVGQSSNVEGMSPTGTTPA